MYILAPVTFIRYPYVPWIIDYEQNAMNHESFLLLEESIFH